MVPAGHTPDEGLIREIGVRTLSLSIVNLVVGAGIFGTCTALELLDRGHSVTLLEQFSNDDEKSITVIFSRGLKVLLLIN